MSLCRQRAEFRMHLIRKIKGLARSDKSWHEDKMEICSDYAKEGTVLDDDSVCGQTAAIPSDDIADSWLTEEDKNLLRYYYYILHEVDDARAGTLDSDTLKKITSMVSTEWQKRHKECFDQLIRELKSDYVTSMKKSIVDFVLQEPFEEAHSLCASVSMKFATCLICNICGIKILFHVQYKIFLDARYWVAVRQHALSPIILRSLFTLDCFCDYTLCTLQPLLSRGVAESFSPEHSIKYQKIRAKLEKRSILLYHPCIRKTLDYWYREYGLVN